MKRIANPNKVMKFYLLFSRYKICNIFFVLIFLLHFLQHFFYFGIFVATFATKIYFYFFCCSILIRKEVVSTDYKSFIFCFLLARISNVPSNSTAIIKACNICNRIITGQDVNRSKLCVSSA